MAEIILEATDKHIIIKTLKDQRPIAICPLKECLPVPVIKEVRLPFSKFLMDHDCAIYNYMLRQQFKDVINFDDEGNIFTIEAE